MFQKAKDVLHEAGYLSVGLDHFVLPMMNYLRLCNLIDYIETSKVIARVAQRGRCMPSV